MTESVKTLKEWVRDAKNIVFFGGTGVSSDIRGIVAVF